MEYIVISSDSLEGLSKLVHEYIDNGWRLQGGVAVAVVYSIGFYQAMVRD